MQFGLVNASTLMDDPAAVGLIAQAVDKQFLDDVGPVWGVYGNMTAYPSVKDLPDGTVPIVIYDDADQAGVLGWHTEELGAFFGRVFVHPVLDDGGDFYSNPALSISGVVSHEGIETLINPTISDFSARADGILVPKEPCDAVEADAYPIVVAPFGKAVMVSNFVYPAWFDAENTKGPFDKLGKLSAPFTMTQGGYYNVMQPGPTSQVGARAGGRVQARGTFGRGARLGRCGSAMPFPRTERGRALDLQRRLGGA